MAAPREVPIILGLIVACASMVMHRVHAQDEARRRSEGAHVTQLAQAAEPSTADLIVVVSTLFVGISAILVRRPPRQPTPQDRETRPRRAALVLALWVSFAALSLWMKVRNPLAEWAHFVVPCAILVLPARTYVRHRRGEAEWAPWNIGSAAFVLGMTRDPKYTWGLLVIALVFSCVAFVQERASASGGGS